MGFPESPVRFYAASTRKGARSAVLQEMEPVGELNVRCVTDAQSAASPRIETSAACAILRGLQPRRAIGFPQVTLSAQPRSRSREPYLTVGNLQKLMRSLRRAVRPRSKARTVSSYSAAYA